MERQAVGMDGQGQISPFFWSTFWLPDNRQGQGVNMTDHNLPQQLGDSGMCIMVV